MKKYIQIILTTMLLISSALDAGVKSKAAKEIVKIFGKYGLNISKKVPKGKMDDFLSAARKLPKTSKTGINRISAGKLIVKYGDDAVKILIKHPDDGLWALKNGGEFVAKNYSKMGKPLLKFLGRNGKRGPKIAKHLGIDLSNNILKLSPKSGLMGLQKITNPKLLKEALANAPDKILKSNIIKNAAIYGDEFLQFTLKHKKPIIVASVFTSGLIAGVNKYPSPPDTLMFNDPEFLFDSDGLHVSQNNHVKYYLKLFSDRNKDSYNNIRMGLDNYSKYKHIIEPIIQEFGLPKSLVALAILESSLNPMAGSSKGAVGPWQFLESTAEEKRLRSYKLKVNRYIDERRDIVKSTKAACKYLQIQYNNFKDWPLAMAAYNAGEGSIGDWTKFFKTNDFWELARKSKENGKKGIPPETRNYVPQIMAVLIILNDPETYNHFIHDDKEFQYDEITIDGNRSIFTYAEACGLTATQLLRDYNPELYTYRARKHLKKMKIPKNYKLKIPIGTKLAFNDHLSKAVMFIDIVKPGDSLSLIAKRNKVWVWQLKRWNGIKNENVLHLGQVLQVYKVAS